MNKIYISGPVTGMPNKNREDFNRATNIWEYAGFEAINPLDCEHNDGKTWAECVRHDLEKLLKCQSIAMLPGWDKSRGAKLEHYIATELGMSVYSAFSLEKHEPGSDPNHDASITTLAYNLVHGDRRKVYGHPLDDYTKTAKLFSGILGIDVTPEQAILCMIGVKLSRLVQSPDHRDSIIDIAGYAECLDLVRQERVKRDAVVQPRP